MFKIGQVVYGITPSLRDNNHVPIATAFHYDHTDYYSITWPVFSKAYSFGLNMTHTHAFEAQNVFDTSPGIAQAMAEQWTEYLKDDNIK